MPIVALKKLTVRFGGLTAVESVDCAVDEQQIFSIIGPNGAGKTTVFNAMTGIYEPTSGTIEFHGHTLERPLTWGVLLACVLVGLLTGLAAALLSVDINALWRATIKRNYAGPGQSFSYSAAANDAVNYWHGRLALEPARGGRWAVRTADGRRTLGYGQTRQEAEAQREHYDELIAAARSPEAVQSRDGRWVIVHRESGQPLQTFESEQDAAAAAAAYSAIATDAANRRRDAQVALVLGLLVGAAGSWAVWNRARRTPEVISRAGIARTFQNIRLFQNMTVHDNVLTAMDRSRRSNIIGTQSRLPAQRVRELLDFVGLGDRASMLAKNLPYGDQRRLEIARALATAPELLLLDEPAAGMNPAESGDLNELIRTIRDRGVTVLLIEHHMRVVMGISDRIAVLDYGVKIAEGTPDEVRRNPQVIAAYLGTEEVH